MAKLTTKKRIKLPKTSFVFPKTKSYPIPDANHARNALSRISANGSSSEIARVRAAVHKKFPGIK